MRIRADYGVPFCAFGLTERSGGHAERSGGHAERSGGHAERSGGSRSGGTRSEGFGQAARRQVNGTVSAARL